MLLYFTHIKIDTVSFNANPLLAGASAMLLSIVVSFVGTWIFPSKKVFDTKIQAPQNTAAA